jgi:quinol monooxygenase YgiN
MRYGRFGSLRTQPGKRDLVVDILLRDVDELHDIGCFLYVVKVSDDDADLIWVTEVWSSPEAHRSSLSLPSVKQAIAEAMPMLTGEFQSQEFEVVGGLGLPPDPAAS